MSNIEPNTDEFATVVQLRDQLNAILAVNPYAKLVADVDGDDHVVIQSVTTILDADGDAHFSVRSYATGDDVRITQIER